VQGTEFEDVKDRDSATRNRFAEIVFRFFFGSLFRDGHFSGDPHPGNYQLLDDGRVAFMDFGMTKRITPEQLEREKAAIRDALDGDASAVRAQLAALGFFPADDASVDSDELLAYVRSLHDWHAEDHPYTITSGYVTQLIASGVPGSSNWKLEKHLSLPPEAIVSRRLETLVIGVMGQLEATANWHRIMGELLDNGPPATTLGEQEAAFFRPGARPSAAYSGAAVDARRSR
jgi:predicted unusual protein kinase regulating ubiquinone biosynthesis (AarF/ABC1/UbiB family)